MIQYNQMTRRSCSCRYASMAIVAVVVMVAAFVLPVLGQEVKQKVFRSPEEAMKALMEAVRADDMKSMMAILGPEGEDIIDSGDKVQDKNAMDRVVRAYQERIDYVKEKEDRVSVILGKDNWPFSIPIVKRGEGWVFDTKAGREEVLSRRIGRNELNTIRVCQAYVEAQQEYASTDRERDGIIQYAQKFTSDTYRRNGLYWEATEGEIPSPLGPFAANAAAGGYRRASDKPTPYHGYYYKILKGQGKSAPGGAYSYVINGHMVAGFALVAWPAEYGVSGVMTFVVNQNGTVYEKDLGPRTGELVKAMTLYNPDKTWKKAE